MPERLSSCSWSVLLSSDRSIKNSAGFADSVLRLGVLHPDIAAHRPFRRLHRLLDYLGISDDPLVMGAYHQLAVEEWPHASTRNWAAWRWISDPGSAEALLDAARAVFP
jgi:hypothetical protein